MKKIVILLVTAVIISSCVSKKEFVNLQSKHDQTKTELVDVKANLQKCLIKNEKESSKVFALAEQVKYLKEDKKTALKQVENLTVLTQSSSDNIKNVISQLSEKDKYINGVREAMTKKDSLNLAIKFHLTKNLTDGIQDKDIEVNVEKTVVFISISDKLLFKSGSYNVTDKAYTVLEKIAKVINNQPKMEVMIEGHTDSTPIKRNILQDNWDLSALRATSITRILQYKYGVKPERLIAAGRSQYIPLAPNDTAENKSKNRRTKIIIMPKLNQFFDLLEQDASK
ncbi:chemotaxis protein MotB [Polaribacter sp. Hel1_33_78]|jgi:chemotaxis protein MotB|uniref:OmpA/MotB family protein n=1 Tax=unclassified Polaribacter TaxID=196858 RepID=UPI00052B6702|nr:MULTISPECIES: OmpA family protein [unclassified Polaribacter]KGL58467.1 OmpA family protein [Polaribacter sp. Hel1_33_49]MBT3741284.1 OmpA family protein [Polaribacter sp.]MBT4412761.1 OmpA family protein [Polaribacter sp.]MBT7815837.1 OmpA family protein [Polaribacter sp.]MDG1195435.1 OmpA family protein [Polaribacter sp.]